MIRRSPGITYSHYTLVRHVAHRGCRSRKNSINTPSQPFLRHQYSASCFFRVSHREDVESSVNSDKTSHCGSEESSSRLKQLIRRKCSSDIRYAKRSKIMRNISSRSVVFTCGGHGIWWVRIYGERSDGAS